MAFRFGLIGGTIDYSKSPDIFEEIFALSGTEGTFELFPTMPPALAQRLQQIAEDGVTGLSVTIPFKTHVIPLLDQLDDSARIVGAVNAIHFTGDRSTGYNTDGDGFALSLVPYADKLKKGKALIIGSGGGSRAVMHTLYSRFGIHEYAILTQRDESQLNISAISSFAPDAKIMTLNRADKHWPMVGKVSLVVNCTPLGGPLHPHQEALPKGFPWPSGAIYYDLNYNEDNASVRAAEKHAHLVIDGRRMLVTQAVRSFKIWSGIDVDWQPIFEKVFHH